MISVPQVVTPYYTAAKVWTWAPAAVRGFVPSTGTFTVEFLGGERKGTKKGGLHRLDLCFEHENRPAFGARLLNAAAQREATKRELRLRHFVTRLDVPPGQSLHTISDDWVSRIRELGVSEMESTTWGSRHAAASLARLHAHLQQFSGTPAAADSPSNFNFGPSDASPTGLGGVSSLSTNSISLQLLPGGGTAGRVVIPLLTTGMYGQQQQSQQSQQFQQSPAAALAHSGAPPGAIVDAVRAAQASEVDLLDRIRAGWGNSDDVSASATSSTVSLRQHPSRILAPMNARYSSSSGEESAPSPLLNTLLNEVKSEYDYCMKAATLREVLRRCAPAAAASTSSASSSSLASGNAADSADPSTSSGKIIASPRLLPRWTAVAREAGLPQYARQLAERHAVMALPSPALSTATGALAGKLPHVTRRRRVGGCGPPAPASGCVDTGAEERAYADSRLSISASLCMRHPSVVAMFQRLESLWVSTWATAAFVDPNLSALQKPYGVADWRAFQRTHATRIGDRLVNAWMRDVLNLIVDSLPPSVFNLYEQDPAAFQRSGLQRLLVRVEQSIGGHLREILSRSCTRLQSFFVQYLVLAAETSAAAATTASLSSAVQVGNQLNSSSSGATVAILPRSSGNAEGEGGPGASVAAVTGIMNSGSGSSGGSAALAATSSTASTAHGLIRSVPSVDPLAKAAWNLEPFELKLELRRHSATVTTANAPYATPHLMQQLLPLVGLDTSSISSSISSVKSPGAANTDADITSSSSSSNGHVLRVHLTPTQRDIESWFTHPLSIATASIRSVKTLQHRVLTLLPPSALPKEAPLVNVGQHDPLFASVDSEVEATRAWIHDALSGQLLVEVSVRVIHLIP